jgi:tetratricopeptide (TPR) repeat protein
MTASPTPAGTRRGAAGLIILVVVICLAAADKFLARVESAEIGSAAQRSYSTGARLLAMGKPDQAIDPLRDAHSLERQNTGYELQLIAALTAAGKTMEAEPLLTEILQREPNDGHANLIAARLMLREGDLPNAEAYYHRAIYGEWSGDDLAHRIAARSELVDLLAQKNRKQELLAELISLQAEAPAADPIQKRLGKLFLQADSPARAVSVYESLLQQDPGDIEAWQGIGEAELEQGHYPRAHEAFLRASLRDPGNESVRAHLQTLNTVTALDPTERHLTSAEKYARSVRILDMARAALDRCVAKTPSLIPGPDRNQQLVKMAETMLASGAPAHVTNEVSEGVLSLSEQLWRAQTKACGDNSGDPDQSALELIMRKLAS